LQAAQIQLSKAQLVPMNFQLHRQGHDGAMENFGNLCSEDSPGAAVLLAWFAMEINCISFELCNPMLNIIHKTLWLLSAGMTFM